MDRNGENVLVKMNCLGYYMQYNGMVMVESVYVNNIKSARGEQSKVEEKLKYRSVLTVCGRTVTPRVQKNSIINSLWGFSVLFQHAEQPGMQLLQVSKFGKSLVNHQV